MVSSIRLGSLILFTCVVVAGKTQAQEEAATKLEQFTSKVGAVYIKGFSPVGEVSNAYGTVEVEVREIKNASQTNTSVKGILITTTENSRGSTPSRSFIDADEIDGLVAGIDYLAKVDKSVTKHATFEAEYATKGGFSIVVFNSSVDGSLRFVVKARSSSAKAFFPIEELSKLKQLLLDAKTKM